MGSGSMRACALHEWKTWPRSSARTRASAAASGSGCRVPLRSTYVAVSIRVSVIGGGPFRSWVEEPARAVSEPACADGFRDARGAGSSTREDDQWLLGKPRLTCDSDGSGQRVVTTFERV